MDVVTDNGTKLYHTRFNTTGELLDFIQGPAEIPKNNRASQDKSKDAWAQASYKEAIEMLSYGWEEGRNRIRKMRDEVEDRMGIPMPEMVPVHDVAGSEVDVARYLDRVPENMTEWVLQEDDRLFVRIVINNAVSGITDANAILARGAMVAAVIDALESRGHRTSLTVAEAVSPTRSGDKKRDRQINEYIVKTESDPLDLERVAFAVAHPSMLRRIFFAVEEHLPRNIREAYGFHGGGGYGIPAEIPTEHPLRSEADIYLPQLLGHYTISQAVNEAVEWLRKAGVPIAD